MHHFCFTASAPGVVKVKKTSADLERDINVLKDAHYGSQINFLSK